jgi:hypothetical protein
MHRTIHHVRGIVGPSEPLQRLRPGPHLDAAVTGEAPAPGPAHREVDGAASTDARSPKPHIGTGALWLSVVMRDEGVVTRSRSRHERGRTVDEVRGWGRSGPPLVLGMAAGPASQRRPSPSGPGNGHRSCESASALPFSSHNQPCTRATPPAGCRRARWLGCAAVGATTLLAGGEQGGQQGHHRCLLASRVRPWRSRGGGSCLSEGCGRVDGLGIRVWEHI